MIICGLCVDLKFCGSILFFLVFVPHGCDTCSDLTCSWVWAGSKQIILSSVECVLPVGGCMVAFKGEEDCVEGGKVELEKGKKG